MINAEIIRQIQEQIDCLEQEKAKIEIKIEAARNYLNAMKEDSFETNDRATKANQTDTARERMRKAQQERQERERRLRIQAIKEFLSKKHTATTKEIADCLNLKENATKRYLRGCSDFQEVRINVWQYDKIPF